MTNNNNNFFWGTIYNKLLDAGFDIIVHCFEILNQICRFNSFDFESASIYFIIENQEKLSKD